LVVAACLTACGGSRLEDGPRIRRCRETCEAAKECPDTAGIAKFVDCVTVCDDLDAANRAAGCHELFDDLYDCIEKHGVCKDADVECVEHGEAYDDCIAEHCSNDPDREDCPI
jgi:hypothetical protein